MKTRLFIGNLASTVTQAELRDKFDALLASHKGEADIGDVEVRCKNENNYFGYVDVHLNNQNGASSVEGGLSTGPGKFNGIPIFLRKYIDLMNNTKWKGSLIKVQLAKESFIDKLKKEQQDNRRSGDDSGRHENNHFNRNGRVPGGEAESTQQRRGNNDDVNSERSRHQRQANDVIYKLSRSNERRNRNSKFEERKSSGNCGFEIVGSDAITSNKPQKASSPVKSSSPSPKKVKKHSRKQESSSSEDESDDDVRDGIPKFKGLLLCYPDGLPDSAPNAKPEEVVEVEEEKTEEETQIQQKLLSIAFNDSINNKASKHERITPNSATKSTINFKKNKQQQSDLRRLQSIDKMKELKAQRKTVINSALSSVAASAPFTEQRKMLDSDEEDDTGGKVRAGEPSHKKSKMTLFDDDDDDDEGDNEQNDGEDDDVFKVKKQFEGARGQKLLELKTRWGNDDRFKIDDRFKGSDNEEDVEPMEQEKEKQFDILTGILGKVVSSTTAPADKTGKQKKGSSTKDTLSSVIMPRYDPEADEEQEEEADDKKKVEEEKKASKKSTKDKKNEPAEVVEKKSSTEPATFKTVSNLKSLFSSSGGDNDSSKEKATVLFKAPPETQQSSFSLLATFGKTSDDKPEDPKVVKQPATAAKSSEVPRTFWQSNPFRYDSSDDEGENEKSDKVNVTIKTKLLPEKSSSSLIIHGKTPFFFTPNDTRFEGLEDYFLHYEDASKNANGEVGADGTETKEPVEDFSVKRQELKSIVKAKIRNSRRKDEKRTLAIKRAIRKRKRKVQHNSKRFGFNN